MFLCSSLYSQYRKLAVHSNKHLICSILLCANRCARDIKCSVSFVLALSTVLWMPARLCLAVWVWGQGGACSLAWHGGGELRVVRRAPGVARCHPNRESQAVALPQINWKPKKSAWVHSAGQPATYKLCLRVTLLPQPDPRSNNLLLLYK